MYRETVLYPYIMEVFALVVMLLALVALAGVVIFFIRDYYKHKDDNVTDFQKTGARIDVERSDRLSNLKFVVDQVNDVNTDIYNTMTSNVALLDSKATATEAKQTQLLGGLDKFLTFSSNVLITNSPNVSILELPGTTRPDVQLMQHVSAMMGLRVTDLSPSSNMVELCAADDPSRCVSFPNAAGDTYITNLAKGGSVVLDAPVKVQGDMKLLGTVSGTKTTVEQATISSIDNGMIFRTGKVGIGSTGFAAPTASLHIQSVEGQDSFKVSAGASDAILIKPDGELVTTKPISLRVNATDPTNVATFSVEATDANTKVLKIQAGQVKVEGDLKVTGAVNVLGAGTLGGKPIATVAAA